MVESGRVLERVDLSGGDGVEWWSGCRVVDRVGRVVKLWRVLDRVGRVVETVQGGVRVELGTGLIEWCRGCSVVEIT